MKTLIVGHGGREAALAKAMANESQVFGFGGHINPTIARFSLESGGVIQIGDVCDGQEIADFASTHSIDLALVSSDNPLEAGVVDALRNANIPTVGPTRSGAEVEWNKTFSRCLVQDIAPHANPRFEIARTCQEAQQAVATIGETGPVVIKPVGLAGGKGVKVVGPHLPDNNAALEYAFEIIDSRRHGGAVIVEEVIEAPEFTIQAITDGHTVIFPPATYDYPYRFEGDIGPGTGGMGSCSMGDGLLPFLDASTYNQGCEIVSKAIAYLAERGRLFSGCLNAGFFAAKDGVRVIEFNARFGDPEAINIMAILDSDLTSLLGSIEKGELSSQQVNFSGQSSIATYLVSPDYCLGEGKPRRFYLDEDAIEKCGAYALFSAAKEVATGEYETIGNSRAVAIVGCAPTIDQAQAITARAIEVGFKGDLQWRNDIGKFPNPY